MPTGVQMAMAKGELSPLAYAYIKRPTARDTAAAVAWCTRNKLPPNDANIDAAPVARRQSVSENSEKPENSDFTKSSDFRKLADYARLQKRARQYGTQERLADYEIGVLSRRVDGSWRMVGRQMRT